MSTGHMHRAKVGIVEWNLKYNGKMDARWCYFDAFKNLAKEVRDRQFDIIHIFIAAMNVGIHKCLMTSLLLI